MSELSLDQGQARLRALLIDTGQLVRATASGRRRGSPAPDPERVELRVVPLTKGSVLQQISRTGPVVRTVNHEIPGAIHDAVDDLLGIPYANWHVTTTVATVQLRFTRKDKVFVHEQATAATQDAEHDRARQHLIAPDDPLFTILKAGGDKRRQVDAFLRVLRAAIQSADRRRLLPHSAEGLRVVDLGCGNAYLTMAAHRYLAGQFPGTKTVGVERRPELIDRSTERAEQAGLDGLRFIQGDIGTDPGLDRVDLVLALHACDTATDDALAQAISLQAPVILAAPCCHHDIQRQLNDGWQGPPGPTPYGLLTREPILRERFADVLTDALRAGLLREQGYSVEVSEFIDSRHTPRNAMIRAIAGGGGVKPEQREQLSTLIEQWRVHPRLAQLLEPGANRSTT